MAMRRDHVMIAFLLLLVLGISAPGRSTEVDSSQKDVGPSDIESDNIFNWIPKWRQKGDCGPISLYILLNIEGKRISLDEVKNAIPFDEVKGCSMGSLLRAGESFGVPMEARFVKPASLVNAPCPFILHGFTSHEMNLGHFFVVVDCDLKTRKLAVIDPVRASFDWFPEDSVLHGYSGYILTPKTSSYKLWKTTVGALSVICACYLFWMTYKKPLQAALGRPIWAAQKKKMRPHLSH